MKTNDNEATIIKGHQPIAANDEQKAQNKTSKKAAAVAGAGIALGSAAASYLASGDTERPEEIISEAEETIEQSAPAAITLEVEPEMTASLPETSANDDMTFSEAFAAARAELGPGSAFEWHGNVYSTCTRQEWAQLHPEEGNVNNLPDDDAPLTAEIVAEAEPYDSDIEIVGVTEAEVEDTEVEILGVEPELITGTGIGQLIVEDDDAIVVHVDADTPIETTGFDTDPLSTTGEAPDYLSEMID